MVHAENATFPAAPPTETLTSLTEHLVAQINWCCLRNAARASQGRGEHPAAPAHPRRFSDDVDVGEMRMARRRLGDKAQGIPGAIPPTSTSPTGGSMFIHNKDLQFEVRV